MVPQRKHREQLMDDTVLPPVTLNDLTQLTRRAAADSMDRMAGALLDAQVDLNPHQIDADRSSPQPPHQICG